MRLTNDGILADVEALAYDGCCKTLALEITKLGDGVRVPVEHGLSPLMRDPVGSNDQTLVVGVV
jgi:hypothetical protein